MGFTTGQERGYTALKPSGLFPTVGFFHQCIEAGFVPILSPLEAQYYEIGGPNDVQKLRFPLKKATKKLSPVEWELSYQEKWVKEHLNAWKTAYGKTPFFEFYEYRFANILKRQESKYYLLKRELLTTLLPQIGLDQLPLVDDIDHKKQHLFRPNEGTLYTPYNQVFELKYGHRKELSILDLVFHVGVESVRFFVH